MRRYMLVTYHALLQRGLSPVGMSFRGCSGEPNRTPRAYHSGDTEDLAYVAAELKERYPDRPLGLVGFSLGGNVALKFLGEGGSGRRLIDAAVAISVPFDLARGALELERGGPYWIYRSYFLRSLKRKVAVKRGLIGGLADVQRALTAETLREFDEAVTAPLHGFRDAGQYYAESSSSRFVSHVRTSTLVIHAVDDPFLPSEAVPFEALLSNPAIETLLPRRGGHVGFVSAERSGTRFWAEEEAARYLQRALLQ